MRHRAGLRHPALVGIAAVAWLATACGQAAVPELTDARDIVARTLTATSELQTAHVRIDLENRTPDGVTDGGSIEASVNLANGELAAQGADPNGVDTFAMIVADGDLFARGGGGEWTRIPDAGLNPALLFTLARGVGGAGPDYLALLRGILTDPRTTLELRGVEDCDPGRCYHTAIGISREQVWPLVVELAGLDDIPGALEPPAAGDLPSISIEVLTDVATLRLVDLVGTATVNDGNSVAIRMRVSAVNQDVVIEPPLDVPDAPAPGF